TKGDQLDAGLAARRPDDAAGACLIERRFELFGELAPIRLEALADSHIEDAAGGLAGTVASLERPAELRGIRRACDEELLRHGIAHILHRHVDFQDLID